MNDWERAICARVKTVRESICWSQSAFAEQLGITRDQLASIEGGRTPLRYDIAWRLHTAFGISLHWLDEGFPLPDSPVDDLPAPSVTGLSPRALLSTVTKHFHGRKGQGKLVAIGPERTTHQSAALPQLSLTGALGADMAAAQALFNGNEASTGKSDPGNRALHQVALKHFIETWIPEVPLGHVKAFSDQIFKAAFEFFAAHPRDSEDAISSRADEIMWHGIRIANAKSVLISKAMLKRGLTQVAVSGNLSPVKSQLTNLLANLDRLTRAPGKKTELAAFLGAPLTSVSRWLSGKREPGGEITLRLLEWVQAEEANQTKSPGRVSPRPERKTQLRKSKHEKPKSGRKKR